MTGLKMSQATVSMKVGDTKKVTATADPANGDDAAKVNAAIAYVSSDEAVATVASDGTITAVAVGTANITATSGSFTATCKATIAEAS
ncbi:Ig-like domain-containing protein [Enterococcus avium]|uniref:Ig-like domain-containing protein n=1 Tax=Enterococcus avium TaxID=33945 RepID=UPI0028905F32|nr:Ig-like domain-containing protein [Enterococcus avium]MDT2485049.1 Ig-like domain-containing protein [Enterococcus avium]MDT2511635.1 Ig-like domain-containing protein [Enterococcus avium]